MLGLDIGLVSDLDIGLGLMPGLGAGLGRDAGSRLLVADLSVGRNWISGSGVGVWVSGCQLRFCRCNKLLRFGP